MDIYPVHPFPLFIPDNHHTIGVEYSRCTAIAAKFFGGGFFYIIITTVCSTKHTIYNLHFI